MLTLFSGVIITVVHQFLLQPFITSGDSMTPTFLSGEYLVIDEISYRFRPPARGDIVVFRYPLNPSVFFIKRLAGLPGDSIGGMQLGATEYYMLGDNRDASFDSRTWGPVQERYIVGRPIFRLYPFSRIAYMPGASQSGAATSSLPVLSTGKR